MPMIDFETMPNEIIFGVTGITEVVQNCRTILTTRKGTVPLDRDFGISNDFIDSPMPKVRANAEQDIFSSFKKYEPRVVIKKIDWKADILSGKVTPHVEIEEVL
jgi:phage baseplate assembly protein W